MVKNCNNQTRFLQERGNIHSSRQCSSGGCNARVKKKLTNKTGKSSLYSAYFSGLALFILFITSFSPPTIFFKGKKYFEITIKIGSTGLSKIFLWQEGREKFHFKFKFKNINTFLKNQIPELEIYLLRLACWYW